MELVATTYLELTHPPVGDPLVASGGDVTVAVERPAYDEYMRLWRSVGGPLDWDGRLLTPAEEVEAILVRPNAQIFIARFRGEAARFCEFNNSEPFGSEIVYFGLSPTFHGRRFGPYLLDVALRELGKPTARIESGCIPTPGTIRGHCSFTSRSASASLQRSTCRRQRRRKNIARSFVSYRALPASE